MSKDTGGPAFPRMYPRSDEDGTTGMTLRDYFAAKAMQSLIANAEGEERFMFSQHAMFAYEAADAMLAERLK